MNPGNVRPADLGSVLIRAFLPARDFARSKAFYLDLGFVQDGYDGEDLADLRLGGTGILLQDSHVEGFAENLMMHLMVDDADAWHASIRAAGIPEKYGVELSGIELRPWGLRDFTLFDPSGVLWRIAQRPG